MANIASQIKRNRQNEKRRLRNREFRGAARAAVKDARASMPGGEETSAIVLAAISALDKAAQKGAVHRRNAARRKGRLMKRLATLQVGLHTQAGGAERTAPPPGKASQKPIARGEKPAEPASSVRPKKTVAKPEEKKPAPKKPAAKKTTKK